MNEITRGCYNKVYDAESTDQLPLLLRNENESSIHIKYSDYLPKIICQPNFCWPLEMLKHNTN